MSTKIKWQDWTNLAFGLWVFVAPWVLQQSATAGDGAVWNSWIVGVAVAALALAAMFAFNVWEEWVTVGLGVWLLASPWILGFSSTALMTWNAVILGVLIAAMAGWALVSVTGSEKTQ
jgi:SPW repeat-containing protein